MTRFNCSLLLAISITDFSKGVLCQDKTWKHGEGTEKEYLLEPSIVRSFQQAKDFCGGNGATLAMIKNKEEQEAVFSLAEKKGAPDEGHHRRISWTSIWLGVTNKQNSSWFGR